METVVNIHGIHGHRPVCVGSLDFVQSVYPWTLSRVSKTLSRLSTDSMDNVQGVHEFSGHSLNGKFLNQTSSLWSSLVPEQSGLCLT